MNNNVESDLPVLLVDDQPELLRSASILLRSSGITKIDTLQDSRQVIGYLEEHVVGVLLLDLSMPHISGQTILEKITSNHPEIPVIIVTATNDLDTAVKCMQIGAFDYLLKPIEKNRMVTAIQRALEVSSLRNEVSSLRERLLSDTLQHPEAFSEIVSQSPLMHSIFQYMEAIAASPQPLLITGETGTGKELIAQGFHRVSRRNGIFVPENVAGLDDNLFADTLFGHVKGAFTGAEKPRIGLVANADDGTLFLDEIGDLSEMSQVKLLRLLQEGQYYPIGSDQPKRSHARIVIATNRDLNAAIRAGEFRKDLFYRLRTHHVHIPPLRERQEDIPLLVDHFLTVAANSMKKTVPTAPKQLGVLLKNYSFPGNIRELESLIYDAVARHQGRILSLQSFKNAIGPAFSSEGLLETPNAENSNYLATQFNTHLPTLKEAEQFLIAEALDRSEGNQGIAAGILGISRQALNKRLLRDRKS